MVGRAKSCQPHADHLACLIIVGLAYRFSGFSYKSAIGAYLTRAPASYFAHVALKRAKLVLALYQPIGDEEL